MGIKANVKTEYKKYHGICQFNVIAVNPTKKQRDAFFNYESQKETDYYNREKETLMLDVLLHNPDYDIKTKVSFWISQGKPSKNGKIQYIDRFGNVQWGHPEDSITNFGFDNSSRRGALNGEPELTEFIRAFADVKPIFNKEGQIIGYNDCRIDHPTQLLEKQNWDEITELLNSLRHINSDGSYEGNSVVAALGVTEDGYYTVYNKMFCAGNAWNLALKGEMDKFHKRTKRMINFLNKDTDYLRGDFGKDPYDLKEYVKSESVVESNTAVPDKMPF